MSLKNQNSNPDEDGPPPLTKATVRKVDLDLSLSTDKENSTPLEPSPKVNGIFNPDYFRARVATLGLRSSRSFVTIVSTISPAIVVNVVPLTKRFNFSLSSNFFSRPEFSIHYFKLIYIFCFKFFLFSFSWFHYLKI